MAEVKPACNWPLGPDGLALLSDILRDTSDCTPPAGFKGFTLASQIVDEHGHVLDGDWDPMGTKGCKHVDTPEYKAAHRKKTGTVKVPKEAPMADAVEEVGYEEAPVVASVGAPEGTFDVQALVAKGGTGGTTVALALIGVASSGAVIKLVKDWMKNRKDIEEKRIELEEKKVEKSDEAHSRCAVERMQLTVQISHLEKKLAQVEDAVKNAGSSSIDLGSFDPEALEDRLAKIEKRLVPVKGAKKGR